MCSYKHLRKRSDRIKKVLDHMNTLNSLCLVLGMDFNQTVHEINPRLAETEGTKSLSNDAIGSLAAAIQKLHEVKIERMQRQPAYHSQVLLKNIEICRMYDLDGVSSNAMKIAEVHHWKHGRKGAGVFWLQQARDDIRPNRIAQKLFDFVGKSISDGSFEQWEGLIEILGSESRTAGGLEFLHKYLFNFNGYGYSML